MIILAQGAQRIIKRKMEQEKHLGARQKMRKEQGAQKNEKGARKIFKKEQGALTPK